LEVLESMTLNSFRRTLLVLPLLAGTPMLAQGGPGQNQGAQQFAMFCAGCHGADGSGSSKGAAIATLPAVVALSDAALIQIVHDGVPGKGMPAMGQIMGDEKTRAVVQYLRTLQGVTNAPATGTATGDADAGRAIFFGKAQCSTCHMVNGEGGFIASDLTAYGQRRDAGAILQAIVKPDQQLAAASRVVEVRTNAGQSLQGEVRYEDNLNLALQTQDGRYHFLTRSQLAEVNYTDHSLMPHDYGTRLTAKELDDVVGFLIATGKNAPADAAPARRGRRGAN
jgi:cytochrome c oxidase cbb3-type subunit 3